MILPDVSLTADPELIAKASVAPPSFDAAPAEPVADHHEPLAAPALSVPSRLAFAIVIAAIVVTLVTTLALAGAPA